MPRKVIDMNDDQRDPMERLRAADPAAGVEARDGFADEVVPLDQVRSRAIDRAAGLAASVHLAAFKITRENCRGELAGKLRNSLDADLALFDLRD